MTHYSYAKLPDYVKNLPYQLPKDTQKVANELAGIIGINKLWVRGADIQIVELLAGFILYSHLNRFQKHQIMQDVLSYQSSRPELSMELQSKVADTLVNPDWDPWSESTGQLQSTIEKDKKENNYLDWLGFFGFGTNAKTVSDWYKAMKIGTAVTKLGLIGLFVSVLSTGLHKLNSIEENELEIELKRRTPAPRTII